MIKAKNLMQRAFVVVVCTLFLAANVAAQELPTILQVDVNNYTLYINDVSDPSRLARSVAPVPPATPANFGTYIILADITAINGSPAKGTMVFRFQQMMLTPTPSAGQAIADVVRGGYQQVSFEFLKPDGSPFGSIFTMGLNAGSPPPGSPVNATAVNNAIVGGTGAFIGAKGTFNLVQGSGLRLVSQVEDPSMRRIHGGGQVRWVLQIFPMFRPEIVSGAEGPVIFHADHTLVTSDKPVRAGETLILYAKGLGPTSPGVNPGDPFPTEPFATVTSPVEVLVNGKSSSAINQIGVPGSTDTYRIDFRVPEDAAVGAANVQISAAWVKGAAVRIPVR